MFSATIVRNPNYGESVTMTYDENRDPEIGVFKEIVCSWTFAASMVGVVFIVLDIII